MIESSTANIIFRNKIEPHLPMLPRLEKSFNAKNIIALTINKSLWAFSISSFFEMNFYCSLASMRSLNAISSYWMSIEKGEWMYWTLYECY